MTPTTTTSKLLERECRSTRPGGYSYSEATAEVSRIVRIGGLERRNLAQTNRNWGYYRKTMLEHDLEAPGARAPQHETGRRQLF